MTKLYIADVSPLYSDERFSLALENISLERREKAKKMRFRRDGALCAGAALLLEDALFSLFGLHERDMKYSLREYGKPYFVDYKNIRFNLSHSGKYVLLAISDSCEVGADIEIKEKNVNKDIAKRFFDDEENDYLTRADSYDDAFYTLWTLKEALSKYKGTGLLSMKGDCGISFASGKPTVIGADFVYGDYHDYAYAVFFEGGECDRIEEVII